MSSGADDTLKSDPTARGGRSVPDDPRYEERGELGRGGIGRVTLAYDRPTEREVA